EPHEAVSTRLRAVGGSPVGPCTSATRLEAALSVEWVIFRALAATLKPRSTNALTIPAPIPCEAPVTMAVFGGPLMADFLGHLLCQFENPGQFILLDPKASRRGKRLTPTNSRSLPAVPERELRLRDGPHQ